MMRLDPALSDEGPNGEESVTTVDLEKAMRQESRQLELPLEDRGEAPKVEGSGEAGTVAHGDERSGSEHLLMEEVVGRANLVGALKRVWQKTSWVCPGSRRTDLNSPNRQVRTRMPGGVGGEGPGSPVLPYPDH